jgi:hypothetical protein
MMSYLKPRFFIQKKIKIIRVRKTISPLDIRKLSCCRANTLSIRTRLAYQMCYKYNLPGNLFGSSSLVGG